MQSHNKQSKHIKDSKGINKQHTDINTEQDEFIKQINDLEVELRKEQSKCKDIQENLRISQVHMVKKEQYFKKTLNELEEKLRGRVWNTETGLSVQTSKNMEKIQDIHSEIMERLEVVQHKTLQILVDQEKEIIKEYRETFLNVEADVGNMRTHSLPKIKSPELKEQNLWKSMTQYSQNIKKAEKLNERLTEKNMNLKLDVAEQIKLNETMKKDIDNLKLKNWQLRSSLINTKTQVSMPNISAKKSYFSQTARILGNSDLEKLKQEILEYRKLVKQQKNAIFDLQEAQIELKFLLKQAMQDINNKLKSGNEKEIEKLIEKTKVVGRMYDIAFPVKNNKNRQTINSRSNKFDEIESTLEVMQNLYEKYEKHLKNPNE
ncbi:hypothetical protein SteCoe_33483 [Stentor coeruleus]|uniref:Uncharacterized protein n=1 Tax=Stentor coeruleus TaxID=5963 RepID=A0A1R2ALX9_9CILI|nr:hypothetical protein SteCoe_38113 [Stentor coeruleus]OMJ68934.1 hypothetical protein SteCoe_33483 [Stentor coeruleus]